MREKYLIVWSACALAAGIWLGDWGGLPVMPCAAAGVLFACISFAAAVRGKKAAAWGMALLFLCACGAARMGLAEADWERQSADRAGTEGVFYGTVSGEALCRAGPDGYIRYPAELSSVRYTSGETGEMRGAVYIYEPWDGKAEAFPPDTAVSAKGKLTSFRFYKNPGKMDLESRYKSQRLIGRIYVEDTGGVRAEGAAGTERLAAFSARCTGALRTAFAPYMDGQRLKVLMTLLFGGHYQELPEGVLDDFTRTGIVHILSVSGSHVALLFGFLCLLGRWLRLPEKAVFPLAAAAIVFYAALAGFVPPVIRAAAMGVLSAGALFFGREREGLHLLGAAAFGMLLWDPFYLFDVSFQLSVGASAGILLFYGPFLRALRRVPRLPRWVAEGTALAFAAQVLTVPVVLYDFHQLPLYFVPANLVVTPLLEWSIILGLMAAVWIAVIPPLAGGFLQLADYLVWAALRSASVLSRLPHAVLLTGGMAAGEAALYYGGLLLAGTRQWWSADRRRKAGAASLALFLLSGFAWERWRTAEAEFFAPDLGASRAAVLTDGKKTIVYYKDGGLPFDIGERELLPALTYHGISRADVVIADFSGARGVSPFTLDLPVREIWLAGESGAAADFAASHPESTVRRAETFDLTLSDGTRAVSDGKSWAVVSGGNGFYLDGGGPLMEARPQAARWFWFGGAAAFRGAVNHDTMEALHPAAAVYAGNRSREAGEDRDYFLLTGIPVGDPWLDGMVTLSFRGGGWEMEKYRASGLTEPVFSVKGAR